MEHWHDFFIAEVGASAALAGLVIVAISINIQEILKGSVLPALANHTLALLTESLIVASIVLVPAEAAIVGPVLAAVTIVGWLFSVKFLAGYIRGVTAWAAEAPDPPAPFMIFIGGATSQAATVPLAAGGILFAFGDTANALYCIAAGILISLLTAIRNTWILLIEILR